MNWGGGAVDIRCGWPADYALDRMLSKSVAGSANVTLTTDESHRAQLTFTGTLTGNINTIVDDTPRRWSAYNNTTGAYTLTHKTSAGTGIAVPQGYRTILECDGTNVVLPINWLNNLKLGGTLTVDGPSTLTGEVQVGGGYGSSGATIAVDGLIRTNASITADEGIKQSVGTGAVVGTAAGIQTQFAIQNSKTITVAPSGLGTLVIITMNGTGTCGLFWGTWDSATIVSLGSIPATMELSSTPAATHLGIYKSGNNGNWSLTSGSGLLAAEATMAVSVIGGSLTSISDWT